VGSSFAVGQNASGRSRWGRNRGEEVPEARIVGGVGPKPGEPTSSPQLTCLFPFYHPHHHSLSLFSFPISFPPVDVDLLEGSRSRSRARRGGFAARCLRLQVWRTVRIQAGPSSQLGWRMRDRGSPAAGRRWHVAPHVWRTRARKVLLRCRQIEENLCDDRPFSSGPEGKGEDHARGEALVETCSGGSPGLICDLPA